MRYFVASLCLLFSYTVSAAPITIDFEEQNFVNYQETTVFSQGFEFYTAAAWGNFGGSDSERGLFYCPDCTATMQQVGGDSFALHSLDLGQYSAVPEERTITLTGYYAGGGSISTDLTTSAGSLSEWKNYTFGASWENLVLLEFGEFIPDADLTAIGFDNVAVTAVPIPAAVWLFGSALAGLGWFRRKQTT